MEKKIEELEERIKQLENIVMSMMNSLSHMSLDFLVMKYSKK